MAFGANADALASYLIVALLLLGLPIAFTKTHVTLPEPRFSDQ
jgi:hypothetical protein